MTPNDLYHTASPCVLAALVAGAGALALRHYRALPAALDASAGADTPGGGRLPHVSIIVPARNEERNLPTLLRSLAALDYPSYDVLVVDDASTDATAAIAEDFAARADGRVRVWVLHGSGPEPGWTGKNFACALGASVAMGEWLLFTDADTEHAPHSLRAAMSTAARAGVRAVSFFTRQRCLTFWERLLLPFAYQQYFVGVRPRALMRPGGAALANGHYFLIARDAYDAAGGHAAVAASIIDDVALAGALKRAGYAPLACRGEALVRVRMYDGLRSLAEGFTKNSFSFLRQQRDKGALVVLSTACSAGVAPALMGAALGGGGSLALAGGVAAYVAQVALLAPWVRRFGAPVGYALLAPLAALVFTGIALSSALHTLARRPVRWKGRGYAVVAGGAGGAGAVPEQDTIGRVEPADGMRDRVRYV